MYRPPRLLDSGRLACSSCHSLPVGTGADMTWNGSQFVPFPAGSPGERHTGLVSVDGFTNVTMKISQLRNLYEKVGMELTQTSNVAGFGFAHDGSVDSIARFITEPVFTLQGDQEVADMVAFLLSFSGSDLPKGSATTIQEAPGPDGKDTHAAVGRQVTLTTASPTAAQQQSTLSTFISLANSGKVGLVVKGNQGGLARGYTYMGGGTFQSDRSAETVAASLLPDAGQCGQRADVHRGAQGLRGAHRHRPGLGRRAGPDEQVARCEGHGRGPGNAGPRPSGRPRIASSSTRVPTSFRSLAWHRRGNMAEAASSEDNKPFHVQFRDIDTGKVIDPRPVSMELAVLLCRSAQLSPGTNKVSFSSLFGAFLCSPDPVSQWMVRTARELGTDLGHPLASQRFPMEQLERIRDSLPPMELLEEPLPWTASATRAIRDAEKLCAFVSVLGTPLDVRHLAAALLFFPSQHQEGFTRMRLERPVWQALFSRFVSSAYPTEAKAWAARFPSAAPSRSFMRWLENDDERTLYSPSYDADAHQREAEDLLDIGRDVDALGALIASRIMAPPLSIGVFGDWGSGKSFFMSRLRDKVEDLANQATRSKCPQPELAFYKNVIQIEFNAWHYADGNLWASLVEHIFSNLRKRQDEPAEDIQQRRETLLRMLASRESGLLLKQTELAQKEKEAAQAALKVEECEQRQQAKRDELELAQTRARDTMKLVPRTVQLPAELKQRASHWLTQVGLTALGLSAVEVRDALSEGLGELRRTGGFLASLADRQGRGGRVLAPGLIFLASVGASLGLTFLLDWAGKQDLAGLTATLTTLGGFAGSVTTGLKTHTEWLRERRVKMEETLREVEKAIDAEIERQLEPLKKEASEAANALQTLEGQAQQQRQSLQAAQDEVAKLKQELAGLTNARLLDRFIQDRTGSDDYRKHLGLVALIRRDFEELSRLMDAVNQDKADPGTPSINRIVLYIDDLDRCSEQRVVEVLQAVHLLLAFRLFVVVVGVDSRWVARCLTRSFRDLLAPPDTGGTPDTSAVPGATAYDYLEKIFQIPIWLRPVGIHHRTGMVKGLLRPTEKPSQESMSETGVKQSGDSPRGLQFQATPHSPDSQGVDEPAPLQQTYTPEPLEQTSNKTPAAPPPPGEEALNPQALVISEAELEFIDILGPILSHTPRVLKRFANTYRLIKAYVPGAAQSEFLHGTQVETAPAQLCLMLLALVTTKPKFATFLFKLIESNSGTLLDVMELASNTENPPPGLSAFNTWLRARPQPFQQTPTALLQRLIPLVSRFSFQ